MMPRLRGSQAIARGCVVHGDMCTLESLSVLWSEMNGKPFDPSVCQPRTIAQETKHVATVVKIIREMETA